MASLLRTARLALPITHVARPSMQCAASAAPSIARRWMSGGGLISVGNIPKDEEKFLFPGSRQHDEYEMQQAGLGGYQDQGAVGPFGTVKAPVRIYSSFHSRIVGCKGGDDHKHRLLWFELKAGPKHVCLECGQVFKLVTPHDDAAPEEAHSH